MLVFTNTEKRLCKLTAREVEIVISHTDTLLTGVGGMLMPRHHGPIEVKCPYAEECSSQGLDCVWAVGVMRSTNDPLGLNIKF